TCWSSAEQRQILDYCASDVIALRALLPVMAPSIDWPRALLRGRYMAAVARMERAGVPVDGDTHRLLNDGWDNLKRALIADIDREYGVYDGTTFKSDQFSELIRRRPWVWPCHPSGKPKLDDDTFRDQAKRYPELLSLRELRASLGAMRLTGLTVGS